MLTARIHVLNICVNSQGLIWALAKTTPALYSCIPTGMHGPTGIFWANLTAFSSRIPDTC